MLQQVRLGAVRTSNWTNQAPKRLVFGVLGNPTAKHGAVRASSILHLGDTLILKSEVQPATAKTSFSAG